MTATKSTPESDARRDSMSPSWKGPWANKWCLSSGSYPGSELANQASYTQFEDSDAGVEGREPNREANDPR